MRSLVIDNEAAQSRDEPVRNGIKAVRKRRETGENQHYVGKRLHFRIYSRKAITYLLMVVEKC